MSLKNSVIEKLASEGKISHPSEEESKDIYQNLAKKSIEYKRILKRKEYYSYIAASKLIFNA